MRETHKLCFSYPLRAKLVPCARSLAYQKSKAAAHFDWPLWATFHITRTFAPHYVIMEKGLLRAAQERANKIASLYTEMAVESDDGVSDIIRAAASSLGYAEIRLLQETAVIAFVTGSDVFLSISTGGGKLLCYAVVPRVLEMLRGNDTSQSVVILVSPARKTNCALRALRGYIFCS